MECPVNQEASDESPLPASTEEGAANTTMALPVAPEPTTPGQIPPAPAPKVSKRRTQPPELPEPKQKRRPGRPKKVPPTPDLPVRTPRRSKIPVPVSYTHLTLPTKRIV